MNEISLIPLDFRIISAILESPKGEMHGYGLMNALGKMEHQGGVIYNCCKTLTKRGYLSSRKGTEARSKTYYKVTCLGWEVCKKSVESLEETLESLHQAKIIYSGEGWTHYSEKLKLTNS